MTIVGETERFRELVGLHLGLHFEDDRLDFLSLVLARRAELSGLTNAEYLRRLEPGGPEISLLARELTVGETYFFRHFAQMRVFTEVAVPARLAAGQRALRIVSAGCSSGEEAFSLAMLLLDQLPAGPSFDLRGYDVNGAALQRARSGTYTSWALRETPAELRQRWFQGGPRDYRLDPELHRWVHFQERNLTQENADLWHPDSLDIIFCRNMLMYLKPTAARELVRRFARALLPGGFLFLGHAENLRGLSEDFELCQAHDTFYYQRLGALAPRPLPQPPAENWAEVIGSATRRIQNMSVASPAPPLLAAAPGWEKAYELLRQERYQEALQCTENLPPGPENLLLRAVLFSHGGQWAAAEEACASLLNDEAYRGGAHYVLGLCREGCGDASGAVRQHELAAHFDPGLALPRLHLGRLARRAGQTAAARRELNLALSLLARESGERLNLFGGGFSRQALLEMCRAELKALGGPG